MPIKIKLGHHSTPIPKGIESLIAGEFARAGLDLNLTWIIMLGAAVKGTHHLKSFRLIGLDRKHLRISFGIQSGDNTTSRKCYLRPAQNCRLTLVQLYNKLAVAGGKEPIVEKSTVKVMEKLGSGGRNGHSAQKSAGHKKGITVSEMFEDLDIVTLLLLGVWPQPTSPVLVSAVSIKSILKDLIGKEPTPAEIDQVLIKLKRGQYVIYRRKVEPRTVELTAKGCALLGRPAPSIPEVIQVMEVKRDPTEQTIEEASLVVLPMEGATENSTEAMLLQTITQLEARVLQLQYEIGRNQAALNAFREFAAS
ncbi:MAG: hypothetical protein A2589_03440 [Candidatus Vogelbacteria bacterium RIFOXYD1_FULL_46_19]|uniref:Uncharacterized protein n=1 Tax=Candidatus Vogelbacteria bacterium RIFOXYD1_FULL_46_19 TaxID=1802439 RepID=A0A1G2QFH0_9BACT|nr:MAG: hypothetical protein A2589_03440 [Candidatus Vogelbacteria bacterium RIFOXYD1_FULL_46_19]